MKPQRKQETSSFETEDGWTFIAERNFGYNDIRDEWYYIYTDTYLFKGDDYYFDEDFYDSKHSVDPEDHIPADVVAIWDKIKWKEPKTRNR